MGEEKTIARYFGWKKMAYGVSIGCFIMVVNLSNVMNSYRGLAPIKYHPVESKKPTILNLSSFRSDVYEINGDIRIHGISSTIFVASTQKHNVSSWNIKPYAQRYVMIMRNITNFEIRMETADRIPLCNRNFSHIPAIVFSGRAHGDNHFHAFADVLFPLFLTSKEFNRTAMFLVTYKYPPWISTYKAILQKLSKYGVYDIDKGHEVLCFSRMIVGLKAPLHLFIDPNESSHVPMRSFAKLVRSAYSLQRESVHDHRLKIGKTSKPRMLIISRDNSRQLMNEHEVGNMARSLGFDIILRQLPSNLSSIAQLVNSVDVMVGVHGAGLTNMIFLPENAVLLQITPFGVDIEAQICFEWAGQMMKLRYLEYKVTLNESSILGKFPADSEFYREPDVIRNRSYGQFHTVYLDEQDVKLDLHRFKKTLLRTLEILGTN